MNNLENLAKLKFELFSTKEVGRMLNWYHLPHERKLAWMQEIIDNYKFVIDQLKNRIKIEPIPGRMNTVYAMGRAEGVNAERMRYLQELTDIMDDLVYELDSFNNIHSNQLQNTKKWESSNEQS